MSQILLVQVTSSSAFSLFEFTSSANVDASVMYRKWKESGGAEDEYKTIIVAQVKKSQEDAKRDGVKSNDDFNK